MSSSFFQIGLTSDATAIANKLTRFPSTMVQAIAHTVDIQNQLTIGYIVNHKLRRSGPDTLARRDGRLSGSVRATRARISGTLIESTLGTNVRYAAVHEYGCAPFTIKPRNKKALRFNLGGQVRFAKQVNHPGFPERAMFRAGLSECEDNYSTAISAAIVRAWEAKS